MRALLRTQAVVLRSIEHGESDRIVTFFSRDAGRLTCIAKGGMRSLKRFCNKLEPFTLLDIDYAPGLNRKLARLDQAELISPFPSLRADFPRYCAASLVIELVICWSRENDSDQAMFRLLSRTLARINEGDAIARDTALFAIHLYSLEGYRPVLDACVECGVNPSAGQAFFFNPHRHGLVCEQCRAGRKLPRLGLDTIRLLDRSLAIDLDLGDRLRFSESSIRETWDLAENYGNALLQREIVSWSQARAQLLGNMEKFWPENTAISVVFPR